MVSTPAFWPHRMRHVTLVAPTEVFKTPLLLPARWECDLSDNSLSWTSGVRALFGVPEGCRVDRSDIVSMYVDESRDLLERLRANAIARCGSFQMDARIRRLDGELRWMRLTATVGCRNGRATHLYG